METSLIRELINLATEEMFLNNNEFKEFSDLLKTKKLVKSESPENHCCVFFIPFNPEKKEILIVNHKKAKQWIVNGGHIESGETLEDAVKREANEELGLKINKLDKPFLLSVMQIKNDGQICKAHFDTWYLIKTQENLNVDYREFNDVKWVSLNNAKKLITHKTYLKALTLIEKLI